MTSNRNLSMKRVFLAVAVVACVSGSARADDSSIGRFGDANNFFNNRTFDKAPSVWREANPHGFSEKTFQSYSSEALGTELQGNKPVAASAATPSFRQTHPEGLSVREFQALSSEGPAWQRPFASAGSTEMAPTSATLAERLVPFHPLRGGPQANADR